MRIRLVFLLLAFLPGIALAQKQLQIRLEVFALPSLEALEVQSKAGVDGAVLRKACLEAEAKLLASPVVLTRSGQRAKVQSGGLESVVTTYQVDGEELRPVEEQVFVGTTLELDPVLGEDGATIDISLRGSFSRPPRTVLKTLVLPGSREKEEVAVGVEQEAQVTTAVTGLSGHPMLIGAMPDPEQADSTLLFVLVPQVVP